MYIELLCKSLTERITQEKNRQRKWKKQFSLNGQEKDKLISKMQIQPTTSE